MRSFVSMIKIVCLSNILTPYVNYFVVKITESLNYQLQSAKYQEIRISGIHYAYIIASKMKPC